MSSSQHVAHADDYYLLGRFNVLADKYVNAYVNFRDAQEHNGWCYVPKNPDMRKNSWSCTVVEDLSGGPRTLIRSPGDGARADFAGATHIARVRQPSVNFKPFCLPRYEEVSSRIHLVYYCAYWVRS